MSASARLAAVPEGAWPRTDDGYHVPYAVFTDPGVYDREQERIFRGPCWSFVALEAELPGPGDFKTTFVGDTPVIVVRDAEGGINTLINACAHRGALVCRARRGNAPTLECVYHQWSFDHHGRLLGVPFARGLKGRGGLPEGFDRERHGLVRLRTESFCGLVFATLDERTEPLEAYLGEEVCAMLRRIFRAPIEVLGEESQFMRANWKLYAENVRDPYHASLLHLFHCTFGLYRSSQQGYTHTDARGRHSLLVARAGTEGDDVEDYQQVRAYDRGYRLADPSLLAGRREFDDDISLVILTVFPNLVVQQIANTLAVRQICPKAVDGFELVWTHFGFRDDDAELRAMRLKQANLIGPAGLISMEDGEATEIVQQAIVRERERASYVGMGGLAPASVDHLVSETSIIGFWEHYRELMGASAA